MRAVPDDEFKLRFPVAKDRTLRRIAIIQVTIGVMLIVALITLLVASSVGLYLNDGNVKADINNAADIIAVVSVFVLIAMFPASWIVAIIEARVQVRRYGWRAVKDPIEAQRVAMREALYDVATGSTRPDVELEHNGDRIMVVPVRRLRPVGARLELTAEREKAQATRQGS